MRSVARARGIELVATARTAATRSATCSTSGKLEMGHARALLTLPAARAIALARKAVDNEWSVRELEEAVRGCTELPKGKTAKARSATPISNALENELPEKLGARVAINHGRGGRGKVVIQLSQPRRTRRHPRPDPLDEARMNVAPASSCRNPGHAHRA